VCNKSMLRGATSCSHTHPFNSPFPRITRVSRYQKGKTNLDFTETRDSEWQWHQLGRMQVCTSLQTDDHASIRLLSFFTGQPVPVCGNSTLVNWCCWLCGCQGCYMEIREKFVDHITAVFVILGIAALLLVSSTWLFCFCRIMPHALTYSAFTSRQELK